MKKGYLIVQRLKKVMVHFSLILPHNRTIIDIEPLHLGQLFEFLIKIFHFEFFLVIPFLKIFLNFFLEKFVFLIKIPFDIFAVIDILLSTRL